MRTFAFAALALAILPQTAAGQSQDDYDRAARQADRAVRAYEDLQYQNRMAQADAAIAGALVNQHICRPMFEQTSLTRRQYIASVVTGRGKQRAVAEECAGRELHMTGICEPRIVLDKDYKQVPVENPDCPKNWRNWPATPRYGSQAYYERQEEIRQLYK